MAMYVDHDRISDIDKYSEPVILNFSINTLLCKTYKSSKDTWLFKYSHSYSKLS